MMSSSGSSEASASSESLAFAAFLPQKNKRDRDISDPGVLARCSVILVRTEGSINLGQIARSCANMGITDLRLVDPRCEIDCSDSRKFAHHARPLMHGAPVFTCMKDCVSDLQIVIGTSARAHAGIELDGPEQIPAYLQFTTARAGAGSGTATATIHSTKFGLVFGNEKDGLTSEELSWCQAYMHIPTYGTYTSINLATAVSITLYTIQRVWRHGQVGVPTSGPNPGTTDLSGTNSTSTSTSTSSGSSTGCTRTASPSASQSQSLPQSQSQAVEFFELASFPFALTFDGPYPADPAEGEEGHTHTHTQPEDEDEKQHHQQLRLQRKLGVLNDNSPAPRSHVDFLNRYWMGTNERFGYFVNEEWRTRYQVIMTQMLNHLQLSYKSINLIHGMLSQYNQYVFGDRALSMARTGRAPAPAPAPAPVPGEAANNPASTSASASASAST